MNENMPPSGASPKAGRMSKQLLVGIISIVIIAAVAIYISLSLKKTPQINFIAVKRQDITQAVSANGTVDAAQDLSLAFQTGGTVSEVDVKVGDTVKKGQILVKLDTSAAAAAVDQAQAGVAGAEAAYQKLLNGDTPAQISDSQAAINTAQTALNNATTSQASTITQQNLIVSNALSALLNSGLAATPSSGNISTSNPTISGSYTSTKQGQYQIQLTNTGNGLNFSYSGLESGSGKVSSTGPVPLGALGLYIQFPTSIQSSSDTWTVNIPNTQASGYLTNLNTYNADLQAQNQAEVAASAAVASAQSALAQAMQNLQLAQTPARPEDIDAAKAAVEAAQAQAETAQSNLGNDILTAPIDGIITSVDVKIGETTQTGTFAPGVEVIKMISNQQFQIDTYLSETDIGKIKVGDMAQVTLSAYGNATSFPATVISIDPAATVTNGVTTYKTTLQFNQQDSRIKTGMDANAVISDETHQQALVIPASAIIQNNNQDFVLTETADGKTQQTPIQTGITDLNGNAEVLSGLSQGQMIAAFGNQ